MATANAPVIVALAQPVPEEPISPELVLVDPALRRSLQQAFERPQLWEVPAPPLPASAGFVGGPTTATLPVADGPAPPTTRAATDSVPAPLPIESARPRRLGARAVAILLPLSITLNVILIGLAVSDATVSSPPGPDSGVQPVQPGSPTPSGGSGAPATPRAAAPEPKLARKAVTEKGRRTPAAGARSVSSAAAERAVLARLVQAPAGKLPAALIDPKTGLAKDNLQALCQAPTAGAFGCVVRPARHEQGEGIFVRYRPGAGARTFTWGRYVSG
jgi:hypothetical protein